MSKNIKTSVPSSPMHRTSSISQASPVDCETEVKRTEVEKALNGLDSSIEYVSKAINAAELGFGLVLGPDNECKKEEYMEKICDSIQSPLVAILNAQVKRINELGERLYTLCNRNQLPPV